MKTEVLAPGGSLDHALWALEGGADAVYVGFQKFSARSHADNLSLDDISALTQVARSKGARVFVAMNIILSGEEVAEAVALAWDLHFRGVSALIVQDLGLALALRRHGPPLTLHASTQAAIHNPGGVAAMKACGFSRVVLARELTLAEISRIVAVDPEMEYEVFVHGALCYAVSGNCMASGMMIGRSANRGDCGQICRTKFELDYLIPGPRRRESPHEEGSTGEIHGPPGEITWKAGSSGAFASMNDLELGARIRDLAAVGVTSFKIEGRMKPPAYAYHTARAYKAFLEGGNDQAAWGWLDEARLRFGRLPSAGWLDGHKAQAQTNPGWAGSLGMPLGTVVAGGGPTVKVGTGTRAEVFKSLGRGDGVMVLGAVQGQTFRGALAAPVAPAGNHVELSLAEPIPFDPKGGSLWLLSRHDGKLPVKKGAKSWRHPIILCLELTTGGLKISTPDFGGLDFVEPLVPEPARGDRRIEETLEEIFRASDSPFHPGSVSVDNRAGAVFLSPKVLKEVRRRWYALVEGAAARFVAGIPGEVAAGAAGLVRPGIPGVGPLRGSLSPTQGVNKLTGFIVDWESLTADHLAVTPWGLALPLAPFTPDETSYLHRFRTFLSRLKDDGVMTPVVPGLANPGHLTWIRKLRAEGFDLGIWFADWAFHTANPWTPAQLDGLLPGLAFSVPWLEDPSCPDQSFFPPLFTSRSCMLRNSFGEPASQSIATAADGPSLVPRAWAETRRPRCPDGCAGHFSARLVQGKKSFRVEARDCINYLISEDGPDKGDD